MVKRIETFGWMGLAAAMLLATSPAHATDGRTYWTCTDTGCVQIAAPAAEAAQAVPVKRPASVQPVAVAAPAMMQPVVVQPVVVAQPAVTVRPVAVRQPAVAAKKAVPLETLIDLSLVTGVFQ